MELAITVISLATPVIFTVVFGLAGLVWQGLRKSVDGVGDRVSQIDMRVREVELQAARHSAMADDIAELKADVKELLHRIARQEGRGRYPTPRSDPPPKRA